MVDIPVQSGTVAPGPAVRAPAPVAAGLVVHELPGAVIAVDLTSQVVHWSPGAERLYGWSAERALGRDVRELIGLRQERVDEVLRATHSGGTWEGEFAAVHADGRALLVYVSNTPLRDDQGAVVGVVGVSLDITAYSAALAGRAEQLQVARQQAELLADRNARLVTVSEALAAATTQADVARVVLAQAVDALHLDAGSIAVVDGDSLRVLATVGAEADVLAPDGQVPLDARTPLTDVLRAGAPSSTGTRAELVDRYPDLPRSSLPESFAGAPLEVEGRVLGVLALSSASPRAFGDEDLVFVVTLGRQCAQALERVGLLTSEREARERLTFLAMAGERLADSLDLEQTLDAVADLAVPAMGDWCSMHLLDEHGQPQLVTVHHRDPEREALLVEVFRRIPLDLAGRASMGRVITSQRTRRMRALPEEVLLALARDEWHLAALRRLRLGSAVGVPLTAHGRTFGVLTVASDEADAYGDAEVRFVEDLARRVSSAVDNALHYRQERSTALTLQRSLLPAALPALPGLTIGHRYLPGGAGAEVGGDWYDLVPLTGGRVGVVIGDVMGRGVAAAAVMGQLRAAVRACALAEDSPSAVLALVDAAMSSLGQTSLTTCLYGVLDPATRRLRLASAGHLPPLVVHPDGGGEYVELDPGPPLGVATRPPPETEVELPDGALLLLFTDGLVEGRDTSVESGLLALRNAVNGMWPAAGGDLEQLCDGLLRELDRDGPPDDDSALLAVWVRGTHVPGDGAVHLHLAGHLSEIARARHLAVDWARRAGCDTDDTALLVTEVATNALRHGGPGVDLWVRTSAEGGLRIEVVDGRADALPQLRNPGVTAEGGRGMVIVSALARSWGTERLAAGKCVWFEVGPA